MSSQGASKKPNNRVPVVEELRLNLTARAGIRKRMKG